MDEEARKRQKRGKSASGELDGPLREPDVSIFEEVEPSEEPDREGLEEFEPVAADEPHVSWAEGEDWEVVEERWEAYLEELFSDFEDDDDLAVFEEVKDTLGWSEGEVIWEGMDFDQLFIDQGEFHQFELLSRRDQRAYVRDRLRTQQASGTTEAGESDLVIDLDRDAPSRARKERQDGDAATEGKGQGQLVSYETETEHRAEDLDTGLTVPRDKRRQRRGRDLQ